MVFLTLKLRRNNWYSRGIQWRCEKCEIYLEEEGWWLTWGVGRLAGWRRDSFGDNLDTWIPLSNRFQCDVSKNWKCQKALISIQYHTFPLFSFLRSSSYMYSSDSQIEQCPCILNGRADRRVCEWRYKWAEEGCRMGSRWGVHAHCTLHLQCV